MFIVVYVLCLMWYTIYVSKVVIKMFLTGIQLCERIKVLRKSLHWSQDELAERSRLQQARLSRLEQCSMRFPITVDEVIAIAEAFDIPLIDFLRPGHIEVKVKSQVKIKRESEAHDARK